MSNFNTSNYTYISTAYTSSHTQLSNKHNTMFLDTIIRSLYSDYDHRMQENPAFWSYFICFILIAIIEQHSLITEYAFWNNLILASQYNISTNKLHTNTNAGGGLPILSSSGRERPIRTGLCWFPIAKFNQLSQGH